VADRRKVAEDRVISVVDPEARHTRKSPGARRDGYRAHVAAGPQTGIITEEKLTVAAGQDSSDPAVAAEFLAEIPRLVDRPNPQPCLRDATTPPGSLRVGSSLSEFYETPGHPFFPCVTPASCSSRRPGVFVSGY